MKRQVATAVIGGYVAVVMAAAVGLDARQAPPPPQVQTEPAKQGIPAFRSRVTLVPLDVRVLDRDGKPVTDLKVAAPFTVDYSADGAITKDSSGKESIGEEGC